MKTCAFIARSLLAVALLAPAFTFGNPRLSPKASDVVGVWSGYSNHEEFLRLELNKDGSGYLSFISGVRDASVDVYRVRKWTLSDWSVNVELQPLTRDAEPFQFQGVSCYYSYMECEFAGKDWNRKATLYAERDLRALGERAQKATEKEKRKRR